MEDIVGTKIVYDDNSHHNKVTEVKATVKDKIRVSHEKWDEVIDAYLIEIQGTRKASIILGMNQADKFNDQ